MTERLSALLHEEADRLDVPPPAAADVLRRGRAVRRRGQVASTVAALAVVGVIAGTALVATRDDDGTGSVGPAEGAHDTGATFSVGTTLWYDDAGQQAEVPAAAVKSLYYTSAGVLVRHGDNNWSDGGGEQRFTLVTTEGDVRPVGVVTEEVAHTTDPSQPYLAWTEDLDGVATLVVHDVEADEEVARVPLPDVDPDAFLWTTLSGSTAYVTASGEPAAEVAWRTGEVAPLDRVVTEAGGGRGLLSSRRAATVVDLETGEELLEVPTGRTGNADLSPDGRYLLTSVADEDQPWLVESQTLHDIGRGTTVDLPAEFLLSGWSSGGSPFEVTAQGITTCDPATGTCVDQPLPDGIGKKELAETLRPGGVVFES